MYQYNLITNNGLIELALYISVSYRFMCKEDDYYNHFEIKTMKYFLNSDCKQQSVTLQQLCLYVVNGSGSAISFKK